MSNMSKTIVYCADGTWNGGGSNNALELDKPGRTNVFRIFDLLQGTETTQPHVVFGLLTQVKEAKRDDGSISQVAMYCHGVGENVLNFEESLIGGAFGGGLTTRIRMGYCFISENYSPGDWIVIVGFSRGAYTARALADMIATQGLLKKDLAKQGHKTLSFAAGAWLYFLHSRMREQRVEQSGTKWLVGLGEHLHRTLLRIAQRAPAQDDFVTGVHVSAVAVFDTVGAMGFPVKDGGSRVDTFNFISESLLPNIDQAFHAVSLDEQRPDFVPSLWSVPDDRLTQTLFPGAHSDVGGGYVETPEDSGHFPRALSDASLDWMLGNLRPLLELKSPRPTNDFHANPLGLEHRPWLAHAKLRVPQRRQFDPKAPLSLSDSLQARLAAEEVPTEGPPGEPPQIERYAPTNLPFTIVPETIPSVKPSGRFATWLGWPQIVKDFRLSRDHCLEKFLDGLVLGLSFIAIAELDPTPRFLTLLDKQSLEIPATMVLIGAFAIYIYVGDRLRFGPECPLAKKGFVSRMCLSWIDLNQQFLLLASGAFIPLQVAHGISSEPSLSLQDWWNKLGLFLTLVLVAVLFGTAWKLRDTPISYPKGTRLLCFFVGFIGFVYIIGLAANPKLRADFLGGLDAPIRNGWGHLLPRIEEKLSVFTTPAKT